MEKVTKETLEQFLQKLGEDIPINLSFYLIGGSALILLGASRETIDIDYLLDENTDRNIQKILMDISNEMELDLEYVPLDKFIPLPAKASERHHLIGHYGKVDVYVFDPYSIALSKLDRGFESDIEDVIFLVKHDMIALPQLVQYVKDTIPNAQKFDINPHDLEEHLKTVQNMLL
jgi:hypothetical protein